MKKLLSTMVIFLVVIFGINCRAAPQKKEVPKKTKSKTGNAIEIRDFEFSPFTLTVKKDTKVTWTNEDSVDHQVGGSGLNGDLLGQDESWGYTFDTTGTFDYTCTIHPNMKGKVVVE